MKYSKEELIKALGIESIESEDQERMLGTFLSALESRTGQAVAEKLTDDQLDTFTKLVEAEGDEAAETWLRENIEGYDAIEDEVCDQLIADADAMDVSK